MKAEKRRKDIIGYLLSVDKPVSGTTLSEKFGVSRQIIVQDITVLKAEGYDILSEMYFTGHRIKSVLSRYIIRQTRRKMN